MSKTRRHYPEDLHYRNGSPSVRRGKHRRNGKFHLTLNFVELLVLGEVRERVGCKCAHLDWLLEGFYRNSLPLTDITNAVVARLQGFGCMLHRAVSLDLLTLPPEAYDRPPRVRHIALLIYAACTDGKDPRMLREAAELRIAD